MKMRIPFTDIIIEIRYFNDCYYYLKPRKDWESELTIDVCNKLLDNLDP